MDRTEEQLLCEGLQLEEFEVLQAIYPDFISNPSSFRNDKVLHLMLGVELPNETGIEVFSPQADHPNLAPSSSAILLSSLPPLRICLRFPSEYPLQKPPEITYIRVEYLWFKQADALRCALLGSWQPGETILYSWIEFVRNGQFLRNLGLLSLSNILGLVHDSPESLSQYLREYDANLKLVAFRDALYSCPICLSSRKGVHFAQLSCSHIFCRSCIEEYWSISVREGDLERVRCIDPECMKAKKGATDDEVEQVLSGISLARWRWLRDKREFERDPDHVYCPACESPVRKCEKDDMNAPDGPWVKFRLCNECRFSFCKVCKSSWHGPLVVCPVPLELVRRYVEATKTNSEEA
ncbi:hypothetical protein NLJ89_g3313 [Agrocybe chaxingu]|uniref:RBR-type E3 ubiquitin transferase n=1 Tax=Agrocybe chaxingu TaxID=84603 RepID=A0A9W8K4V5_9AGAR|nr:hypothetical protein NLJ89_g3313 [Agrocybe chaxingu]